ncbi:MAG: TonB-dependent receptor [Bacteroidota bacterium]|nr:TonB-dependent receptor [Bacteroidota bacterium]
MKIIILLCLLFTAFTFPQTKITGTVLDSDGKPLPGANIFIKDTYDGASADTSGHFNFTTTETGKVHLGASFIGYKTFEKEITVEKKKSLDIAITLEEDLATMKTVVISAGYFEAGDEKKSVILKPLDIVTTGAQADVFSALNTLPGAQQVGEKEGLFVRGGDAVETKVFIDELLVQKPFYSSLPDIPSRSRFSAFYFKGTMFSTGGYSAQYGQALSSALILKMDDLPEKTSSSLNLMSVGVGASHTQRWENSSLAAEVNYYNLKPYQNIHKQRQKYDLPPIGGDANLLYRYKTSNTGMVKLYAYYNSSDVKLYTANLDSPTGEDKINLANKSLYLNANYREMFGKWTFFAGSSFNIDRDNILLNTDNIFEGTKLFSAKSTLIHPLHGLSTITFGAELSRTKFDESYNILSHNLTETNTAAFVETDIFITKDLAARIGGRVENSKFLNKTNFAPRTSLAYKIGEYGQFNFAYGKFYQTPDKDYLFLNSYTNSHLTFENAEHYILNYQYIVDDITFRIEGYYKNYGSLVKGTSFVSKSWEDPAYYDSIPLSNAGKGYAKGIDVFWRDRAFIPNTDYWLTYSYLDTKREYRNYPIMATPPFAAKHTFSAVLKRWFPDISTYVGLTYTHASGRTYYNPNNKTEFLGDRTMSYNNLAINFSYVTYLVGNYTVVYFSVDNLPGFANVYSYRYSNDGLRRMGVLPTNLRSAFLGIFMNFNY